MAETQQQKLAREMTHKHGKVDQSARDNPLTGSAMQALARGWLAGTIGMPGDLEGLGRMGLNALGAGVDKHAALPTTDFFKEWLPGKQTGDENVATVGSMFGGAGVGTAAKGVRAAAKATPGALTQMAKNAAVPATLGKQAGVIKAPGGNWLTGSVEDALKGLKRPEGNMARQMEAIHGQRIGPIPEADRADALNNFIDKQLTRYVKNDMATERDPVRALAERGTLHVDPEQLNFQVPMHGKYLEEGQTAVAQAPGAKAWEGASDIQIAKMNAGELLKGDNWFPDTAAISNAAERNPWLATKPDSEVLAVRERMMAQDLGFDHLIDELRNATNPQSGLPRELLLKPESLDRVSVPQAVEHVAKINAWREAQKVEANAAKANNAATHVFKEYAENNPKGLKWVELKTPDRFAEGETQDKWGDLGRYATSKLKDALKYEGDTMGHCVGGYCDDVASGASRIFSLRDAKGQPHVTVEVKPADWYRNEQGELMSRSGGPLGAVKEKPHMMSNSIVQIKGKGNKKPNDEYLPFVQDFVKSGKWSDVGDLGNAGLLEYTKRRQAVPAGLTGRTTMGVPFEEVGIPEGYYSESELLQLMRDWQSRTGNAPKYAAGGAVPTDAEIQQFYAAHKDDPAALAAAMREHNVGTSTAAQALGQTQEQLVNHINSGRVATPVMSSGWDGGDTGARTWNYDEITPEVTQSLDQFKQKYAHAIGPDGRFKGPQSGIDYAAEGMTPEEYYKARIGQQYQRSGEYGLEQTPTTFNTEVNADWRPGPDNGGGFLGGVTRAVGGLAKGVMSNPALSMALTAGLAPMVGKGLQSAGMSAGMAKTATPLVSNAVKTVAGGGSLADAAKNAGIGYLGGQAGQLTEGATGMDFAGKVASSVTQSALRGKPMSIDALATQYATGKLTDLSGLDPSVASIVVNLAKRKRPSATGALSALAKYSRL